MQVKRLGLAVLVGVAGAIFAFSVVYLHSKLELSINAVSVRAVGVDGEVEVLVYQKVVAGTLADDFEIVHEGGLKGNSLDVGLKFCYPRGLVFNLAYLPQPL